MILKKSERYMIFSPDSPFIQGVPPPLDISGLGIFHEMIGMTMFFLHIASTDGIILA
jgi:hypothetical protein